MRFELFGLSHLIVLALTALLSVVFVLLARDEPDGVRSRRIGFFMGTTLLVNFAVYNVYRWKLGYWEIRYDLPMQLCDWAGIAVMLTLFLRKQFFFEISYFWIMAGSIQALVTPANVERDFPDFFFFTFFISHSILVIASIYFLFGWRMRPLPGAVRRVFLSALMYLVSAALVNLAVDGNYGFLMKKPDGASLLDYLGPWPIYIVVGSGLAFVFFSLLYLPFYFTRKK